MAILTVEQFTQIYRPRLWLNLHEVFLFAGTLKKERNSDIHNLKNKMMKLLA